MHKSSMVLMGRMLDRATLPPGSTVLDVGSAVAASGLNQSYVSLCKDRGLKYIGMDIRPGPNVDIIMDVYDMAMVGEFDAVICGSTLEHLAMPVLAVQKMKDAVKVGGWVMLVTPVDHGIHRYPIDCWRFYPDSMGVMLEGFEDLKFDITTAIKRDCWGMGRKPSGYKAPWLIERSQ